MNVKLLNEVKNRIIAFANDNSINLQAEFGTVEKFQQFVIFFTIRAIVEICGLSVAAAYDIVAGDGAYAEMADAVWAQLQTAN